MEFRLARIGFAALALVVTLEGSAAGQTVSEFPIPTASSGPYGIVTGPDGNLWFTESYQTPSKIGRITTAGVVTEFTIPTSGAFPSEITAGPDGNLWFTEAGANKIGRITTAGAIAEFVVPTSNSQPQAIAAGPDGALWFVEHLGGKVGRITTAGVVTAEYPIPTSGSEPIGICLGPDGNLWFTEQIGNVGRITTAGAITEYPIPTPGSNPNGIAPGPEGNLWFGEAGKIGRITTAGVITEFPVNGADRLRDITAGPDGNMWFTDIADRVGKITLAGDPREFAIPTAGGTPFFIVTGPDGALWFTELNGSKIGRITTSAKFYTVAPCRVADTRNPPGPYGGPALFAKLDRTFVIGGQCGIPTTATAASFNFTATQPSAAGDLRVFPAGGGRPLVSTLNWTAGQTRANNAVVALGLSADVTVHPDMTSGTVDLIVDVTGYFQ